VIQVDAQLLLAIAAGLLVSMAGVLITFARIILLQIERRIGERFHAVERLLDERFRAINDLRAASADHWQNRCAQQMTLYGQFQTETRADLSRLHTDLETHRAHLEQFQIHVTEEYISKEAWLQGLGDLSAKLDRLAQRLHP
jgi:hypothetical protein